MTVEARAKALASELHDLSEWEDAEKAKIDLQLKSEGRYRIGLDVNNEAYREIIAETKRRYREIVERYKGLLPPGTRVKLW